MSYAQNFGLIRTATGKAQLLPIPLQKLPDDYVRVKTIAVAINPTDWTTLEAKGLDGSIVGCDWAGIIEEVGPAVTKRLTKGDRVAGFSHGGNDANHETGAFARYIIAKGDLVLRIPDGVSWEEAATTGVAFGTVGMGLYQILKLPLPGQGEKDNAPIFIYGGSTATGTIAIQFAKLSGRKVITVCSPKHNELVKSRGADVVYDYHTPNVGEQIRADTHGKLEQVFDTVAVKSSAEITAQAIGPNGGVSVSLLAEENPREDVKSVFFLGYESSGETYIFEGDEFEAKPETFQFVRKFLALVQTLWDEGKIQAHPQRVGPAGLVGVISGMQAMKEGKVSGEKLVYLVDETKWPA